jgi:hypothetical protein
MDSKTASTLPSQPSTTIGGTGVIASSTHITVTTTFDGTGGAELSSTTIVLEHVDALPQSSVAVQVLTSVYSCGHVPGMESVVNVMVGDPSQASVAVAVSKFGTPGHSTNGSISGHVITGATVSSR